MTVISLLLIGYSQKLWMLLLAAAANAFGFGAVQPMLQSLCMKANGIATWTKPYLSVRRPTIGLDNNKVAAYTVKNNAPPAMCFSSA